MISWQHQTVCFLCLVLQGALTGEPYDFDASAFEKKPYSLNGSIELRPSLALLNRESESYKTQYGLDNEPRFLDTYLSRLEISGDYRKGPFLFFASGLGFAQYERYSALLDYDAFPYEVYGKLGFEGKSTNVWLGKKTFKWGKGYAYNPTAFAARPKDINDVEANLEGYWSLSGEFIRSFSSRISTVALNVVIIPEYKEWNTGYIGQEGVSGAAQLYMLAFDTDVDFCFYSDNGQNPRLGIGFSRNIIPNLEVHGEAAYAFHHQVTSVTEQYVLETVVNPVYNALLGARYLTKWNTTVIAEYIRNGQGLSKAQMDVYYSALRNRAALSPDIRNFLNLNAGQYMGQFAMRDYVYARISHPEPFGLLYLTPSAYAMANLRDASLMTAFEIAYTRFKNTTLTGKMMVLQGGSQSEYGSKTKKTQMELRGRFYF
ncbi:MAG: hypothetical protein A2293_04120 [Elusimicrobia bacterium RIFOXYB2_FULL_49_7]|nr:MAG: hypothetical protein A2293_04120 [Elusimicrobia bacterium RIFOXYB2_FULL_49_7]